MVAAAKMRRSGTIEETVEGTEMTIADYSMATAARFVGRELGVSDWVAVDQDRINKFAACTGDRHSIP